MTAPPEISPECRDWARAANYALAGDEDGTVVFRSEIDFSTRYFIRRRGTGRLELSLSDDDGERPVLFVAELSVLERYLLGPYVL